MKLYELSPKLAALELKLASHDSEDSEPPPELLADLEQIKEERHAKIISIARLIKNIRADAAAHEAEIERLTKNLATLKRKSLWLQQYIKYNMKPGEKFRDATAAVSCIESQAVEITDREAVPTDYWRTVTKSEPSKTLIREALERHDVVPGAELITRANLVIR